MFLVTVLAIYSVPTIYTYFRLKIFFTQAAHKTLFTLIYTILALGFPLAELLSHQSNTDRVKVLILLGSYALPFLLYLFLLVLLLDLLRGANHLLKFVSTDFIRGRKFRLTTLWLLFVVSGTIVVIGAVHLNTIRVSEYRITIPRKSAVISHLKIAMAADFHLGPMTNKRFLKKFTKKINKLRPDILLIPGDIVEGHGNDKHMEEFARQFRQIKPKYGIYASPGNHESHGKSSQSVFFTASGIKVLADTFVVIDNSFCLVGRKDRHSYHRLPISELLAKVPHHLPIFVLDHRPIDLKHVSKYGVDIQFSGHTHNGQLFPLNFIVKRIYELGWGYKKIRNTHFFVTSGIQVWGPPVRTAGNSEIMIINVDFIDS